MITNGVINTSNNGNSIYQFNPNNIEFGSQIQAQIYQYQWFQVVSSIYSQLVISFTDQDGLPLAINDTAITLTLLIRPKQKYLQ